MENLENVNFETERQLVLINDLDHNDITDDYTEEDWNISLDYNGCKLTAVIDFTLELKEHEDGIEVMSTDITIKQLLDENEDVFSLSAKEEISLEHRLEVELKIEF